MKGRSNSLRLWCVCLALVAGTMALFSPLFHYDFLTFDDQLYVTENPYVLSGLHANSLLWAFQTSTSGNWIPLTWISHMLDCQIFGLKAGGHHFTNVLIHAINAALLFLILHRMTGATWRSAMVAGLFAWHPAHVESVAWIAERKDVLGAIFGLLALLAYASYAGKLAISSGKRKLFYLSSILLFALSLLAKPMLVTLPFVMLLLDFWPLGRLNRSSWPRLVMEKTPMFALTAACCAWTIWAQEKSRAVASLQEIHFGHRLEHVLASYLDYAGMLLFPRGLAIFYPYPAKEQLALVMAGAAMLVAVSLLAIVLARRRPWMAAGWFWFVGMMVPVIGLVQVGDQSVADRYTYLPSIGLFLIAAWGGAEMAGRLPVVKWLAVAAGAALIVCTWRQERYWKDTRAAFGRALKVTRNNYVAMALLGSLRAEDGDLPGAMRLYRESLAVKPNYFKGHFFLGHGLEEEGKLDEAQAEYELALRLEPSFEPGHIFLGVLLAREGRNDQAAAQYEAVLKINPRSATAHNDLARLLQTEGKLDESAEHYLEAIKYDSSLAQAHNNLGILYLQKGRPADAIRQLREALRLNPGNAETEINLALALNQQEQWKEALELLQRLAPAQPNNANLQYQYGLALAHQGQTREAMSQYAKAILLTPNFAEALNALSWILATDPHSEFRNGDQALEMAERACELTHRERTEMLLTLSAAYAEAGRFKEALSTLKTARTMAKNGQLDKAPQMQNAFEKRQPYRDF